MSDQARRSLGYFGVLLFAVGLALLTSAPSIIWIAGIIHGFAWAKWTTA